MQTYIDSYILELQERGTINTLQTTSASPWIIYVTDFVSLIYNLKAVL